MNKLKGLIVSLALICVGSNFGSFLPRNLLTCPQRKFSLKDICLIKTANSFKPTGDQEKDDKFLSDEYLRYLMKKTAYRIAQKENYTISSSQDLKRYTQKAVQHLKALPDEQRIKLENYFYTWKQKVLNFQRLRNSNFRMYEIGNLGTSKNIFDKNR